MLRGLGGGALEVHVDAPGDEAGRVGCFWKIHHGVVEHGGRCEAGVFGAGEGREQSGLFVAGEQGVGMLGEQGADGGGVAVPVCAGLHVVQDAH